MGRFRIAMAHTRGNELLSVGRGVLIGRTEFEETDIGKATIRIAAGRQKKIAENRRAHGVQLARNRIGQQQAFGQVTEDLRLGMAHEGPGHRFIQPLRGERPAHIARAALFRRDRHRW